MSPGGTVSLHITRGPDVRTETEHVEEKWCFRCRAHLLHRWIVFSYSEPSYYEPIARWDCPRCHRDETLFPGWTRYPEEP